MAIISPLPFIFQPSTVASSSQVNADFAQIVANVNANAAPLSGVVPPISVAPSVVFGLAIGNSSNVSLSVIAASLFLSNPSNTSNVLLTSINQTLNTGTIGAGGLDTGTIAANTIYYIWIIYNPVSFAVSIIISLSSTAPALPIGYTYQYRVGVMVTDGSNNIRPFNQYGKLFHYIPSAGGKQPVAASGVAGNILTDPSALITVSLATLVPPTAHKIEIVVGGAGVNFIVVTGSGTAPLNGACIVHGFINAGISDFYTIYLESNSIYYGSNSASGYLCIYGWEDSVLAV
jgi:hypothetical protein